MIFFPREIISKIGDFLDVCSFRSLCISNKYLYESYPNTNRKTVSFADVPSVFKQRIRNYQNFCANAVSFDVSGTSIDTFGLVEVIATAPNLVLVTALECPNIRNGKLFVTLATKRNKRRLKEMKNRKIHVELSIPESGTICRPSEFFTGILTSNIFAKSDHIKCRTCTVYNHIDYLTFHGYIVHDYHYVNACPKCRIEYVCGRCNYVETPYSREYDSSRNCGLAECVRCTYNSSLPKNNNICKKCELI
jgi:hypothetical protein